MEIWLRTNARALWLGMILPGLVALTGLLLALGLPGHPPALWMRPVGAILLVLGWLMIMLLILQLRRPRLAYGNGHLLVWLGTGGPIRVPIDVVECFFLGQAESMLPSKRHQKSETS